MLKFKNKYKLNVSFYQIKANLQDFENINQLFKNTDNIFKMIMIKLQIPQINKL